MNTKNSNPRLLMCDLDDALLDRTTSFRSWGIRFLADRDLPAEDIEWLIATDGRGFMSRLKTFDAIRDRYGLAETADSLVGAFTEDFPGCVRLSGGAIDHLIRFREEGWRIAIVTNGRTDMQRRKCDALGLARYVDAIVISEEVASAKPDAGIFKAAADACGANLADAWVIGDEPTTDIAGAHALGLPSAWITMGRAWAVADFKPTIVADSFSEATAMVGLRAASR